MPLGGAGFAALSLVQDHFQQQIGPVGPAASPIIRGEQNTQIELADGLIYLTSQVVGRQMCIDLLPRWAVVTPRQGGFANRSSASLPRRVWRRIMIEVSVYLGAERFWKFTTLRKNPRYRETSFFCYSALSPTKGRRSLHRVEPSSDRMKRSSAFSGG